MASVEKAVKSKGAAKHKLTWIVKIFAINLYHDSVYLIGRPIWFHNFFHTGHLK